VWHPLPACQICRPKNVNYEFKIAVDLHLECECYNVVTNLMPVTKPVTFTVNEYFVLQTLFFVYV
jgi:hypothetical protein